MYVRCNYQKQGLPWVGPAPVIAMNGLDRITVVQDWRTSNLELVGSMAVSHPGPLAHFTRQFGIWKGPFVIPDSTDTNFFINPVLIQSRQKPYNFELIAVAVLEAQREWALAHFTGSGRSSERERIKWTGPNYFIGKNWAIGG